ncbi:hypothetical protein GCM10007856_53900 [Azospirillum oryzae]|nr:hypothetical protein GCM10007856_53900 [Azospirillum oryzae]
MQPLKTPLPPAHAQTKFALTRQADLWSAESGERMGEGDPPAGRSSPRNPLTPTLSPPFGEAALRLSASQAQLAMGGIGGFGSHIGEATP